MIRLKNTIWKRYLFFLAALLGILLVGCFVVLLVFRPSSIMNVFHGLASILMPFIYGLVIAYVLRPACEFFENGFAALNKRIAKKAHPGLNRMCAILVTFVIAILIIIFLFGLIIPQLITSISSIVSQLPDIIDRFQAWIGTWERGEMSREVISYVDQIITTLSDRLQNYLSNNVLTNMQDIISNITSSFLSLMSFLKNFGLGCIVSIYLLGSREKFLAQGKLLLYSIFPEKWNRRILNELHLADRMFIGFITGKLLDSAIMGGICFVFCWAAGMPYTVLVSVIVGVTNMIPFFGPYLGAIPSAILILTESPYKCVIFLVFIIILQQIDGNIIGPHILGDKLGLSGFWVLFAILFFGSLWGLVGILIGVPLFAVIYDLVQKLIALCLQKRRQTKLLEDYREQFSSK